MRIKKRTLMKAMISILFTFMVSAGFAVQINEHPGGTFGKNYDEKNNANKEPKQWGWNNDTDYDLSVINVTDRFKGPSTSSGWRINVNKGTFIRIDNDLWKIKEPPDINSGIGEKPTP